MELATPEEPNEIAIRLGVGERDQLLDAFHAQIGIYHKHGRRRGQERDREKSLMKSKVRLGFIAAFMRLAAEPMYNV